MAGSSSRGCGDVNINILNSSISVPGSATEDNVVTWGATTSSLKDSGISANNLVLGPASSTDGVIALFDGTTGKLLKNSSISSSDLTTLTDGSNADSLHVHTSAGITDFDEAAQDAVGSILTDSSTIDFTYNDGANTITATTIDSAIDHDSLSNFVANEHIDHSSITLTAGTGLSGGGDITANRTFNFDPDSLSTETPTVNDYVVISDDSDSGNPKKSSVSQLANLIGSQVSISSNDTTSGFLEDKIVSANSAITIATLNDGSDEDLQLTLDETAIDHDNLTNFVANEHVDHTSVTLTAGAGLAGGGDISANRSFAVDINSESAVVTLSTSDELLISDIDDSNAIKKTTIQDILDLAGAGYTDEQAQDAVGNILTDSSTIDFTYNDAANTITASTIDSAIDHDSLSNFVANEHVDHTSVTLTAGAGLSGGGDISANRSFAVDIPGQTAATVATGDLVLVADVDDSNNLKKVTAGDLAALAGGGDAWSDPVDADIVPDGNDTRDLGSNTNRFAEAYVNDYKISTFGNLTATSTAYATNSMQTEKANSEYAGMPVIANKAPTEISNSLTSNVSVFIWMKTTDNSSSTQGFFQHWNSGHLKWFIGRSSSVDSVYLADSGGIKKRYDFTTNIKDGNWHLIGFTFDGSAGAGNELVVYVDGAVESVTKTTDSAITTLNNPSEDYLWVGRATSNYINANFYGATIWNKTLTGTEVTELWNSGAPFDYGTHSANANLQGYWLFGDDVGDDNTTAVDQTANANNFDLFNTPTIAADAPSGGGGDLIKLAGGSNAIEIETTSTITLDAGGDQVNIDSALAHANANLGFYGTTPIAQPSATGETTGFTAGSGTSVNDDSTFTGNVGSTAYRINDIVKHLKNLGLIAQ